MYSNIVRTPIPVATSLFVCLMLTTLSQGVAGAAGGTSVAVLDVARVFKNHTAFMQQTEAIKQEIAAFEDELKRQRQAITEQAKALEQYRSGSPEYKRLEEDLAKRTSDIQVRTQLKKNEILNREAKLYYDTYQQILGAVGQLAQQHGIEIVLRFDSESIDPANRGDVQQGVNRFVIMQRNLDLTQLVINHVNGTQARR